MATDNIYSDMNRFVRENPKIAFDLLRKVMRIRLVEETIASRYSEWKMRCPTHLSTGQEAVSAGVCAALRLDDLVMSTHRCHGHYLAKGGDLKKMIAEIYGKETGCSHGKGGSMHLIDKSVGFMGSTAIVGGTIPIAVGLGLSIKLRKTRQISVVFFGDGAVEEGVFFESVNFAILRKLPVLFVCENNLYSVYSPLKVRQPKGRKIYTMVSGLGCPSEWGDGNNAVEVYQIVRKAITAIRKGAGPFFLEFSTYRWREHCGPNFDNNIGYRSETEYQEWKKRDPLEILMRMSSFDKRKIASLETGIKKEIEEAFEFAENSPYPKDEEVFTHLYDESGAVCQQ